jgi:uncharacterized membrane protein YhaH (DUF805 family)
MTVQWYYVSNGTQIGPVDRSVMEALIFRGSISTQTPVWREGMQSWEEAGLHFSFPGVHMPPPLPIRAPAESPARGNPPEVDSDLAQTDNGPDALYSGAPARSFGEAISICFKKYFSFSGRASRSEYWYFYLFNIILGFGAGFLDGSIFGVASFQQPFTTLALLMLLLPSLAAAVRRLHDTNRSGWWLGRFWVGNICFLFLYFEVNRQSDELGNMVLVVFIAYFLVYSVVLILFLCQRGDSGRNRFG